MSNVLLMYHCVYLNNGTESGFQNELAYDYKISKKNFETQVRTILNYSSNKKNSFNLPLFTFDDGGVSVYTVIAPILEQYGQRGLFFISTGYINRPGFLTSKQILDLYKRGHLIGTHSHTHPINMADLSFEEIDNEWKKSISILSNIINDSIVYASIPNGYNSDCIMKAAFDNGICYLFTSVPTCRQKKYKSMDVLGRYVILNRNSDKYVKCIVSSYTIRFLVYFKFYVLLVLKKFLGRKYSAFRNFIIHLKK